MGTRAILTGRVSVHDGVLQVAADLVDASNNTEIWGGQYTRKPADLQAIEREVAMTVSEKLRLPLTDAQKRPEQAANA